MGQSLDIKIAGLYTFPSDISSVPQGALSVADNIVIDRENTAEPRRGFDYLRHNGVQTTFSNPGYRANKIFFYQGYLIAHYDTNIFAYHDPTTGWVNYSGTTAAPTSTIPVRSAQANQNLYYTTDKGVYKLDAYNGTPRLAGCPAALDCQSSIAVAPPATFLPDKQRCAYRLIWGIKDANGNLILGAPSQREEITNTSGSTAAIQIVASIPSSITTAYFYQLYRSHYVDETAHLASPTTVPEVTPSDELGLVYEGNPSPTDFF